MPKKPRKDLVPGPTAESDSKAGPKSTAESTSTDALAKLPALPFAVVGVGASAGGVEALTQLFKEMPPDTGMAFVVVQHLDPNHSSSLPEILGRATKMRVRSAEDGEAVEPDRVYVIPPGAALQIEHGKLRLTSRAESPMQFRGIDQFLRTLAVDQRHLAIGVVLSGTSSDGTLGVSEIKAEGGLTFAQDESAQHPEMPRSAVAAGAVDFELPPAAIAHELARIARHPYVSREPLASSPPIPDPAFHRILQLLYRATGVDFGSYKRNTLYRRIQRRAVLQRAESFEEFVHLLEKSPADVEALFQDVLINVTTFFRDPEAFDTLKSEIFPRLTADRSRHETIRVWSLGCSTGEEAYSIAIAYREYAEASGCTVPLQLFATDLNGSGIERARAGIYPRTISQDVSAVRLRRFFSEVDGSYRIAKPIRDACIFAQHNALAAPPFSHMDLVSCRNLLIYLDTRAQQRLIPLLHYSLRPQGFLWLGNSESIGNQRDLFELDKARHNFYRRRPGPSRGTHTFPLTRTPVEEIPPRAAARKRDAGSPTLDADRIMLSRYAPPAVVINDDLEVLQFRGDTGRFLSPAPGRASLNLIGMLRPGLRVPVRSAIHKARKEAASARADSVRLRAGDDVVELEVEVVPISAGDELHFLVIFDESQTNSALRLRVSQAESAARREAETRGVEAPEVEIARLNAELATTREYVQAVIEQQEAANEELQAANEEVQSANEELQSTNEELETSKEEIQSANEELVTLNDALQGRNQELSLANDDFVNLLASVQMAILILGPDLRIRRFTPAAGKLLDLFPHDIGRPIGDVRMPVALPDPEKLLHEVMETMTPNELEVRHRDDRWYSLRIRPYRTQDSRIEGVVVVFVDIDFQKNAGEALRSSAERLRLVRNLSPVGLFEVDEEGRLLDVNDRLVEMSGWGREELHRRALSQLLDDSDLRAKLDEAAGRIGSAHSFEARLQRSEGPPLAVEVSLAAQPGAHGGTTFLGSFYDLTDRLEHERATRTADESFRSLADSAPVLIWVNSLEGCEFVNRAYLEHVGAPKEEVLGMKWADFVHPDDRAGYLDRYNQALADQMPFFAQMRLRRADGAYRWMKSIGLPRFDSRGQLAGYVGSSFDIHDLKLAESSLRDDDRRKNEFLAMLAHELRNPLAPIRNVVEMLKAPDLDAAERAWAGDVLDRQVEAMSRMIEDLLDVSRITQGKVQLRLEPTDLAALLRRLVLTWQPRFGHRQQSLELECAEGSAMALLDVVRFEQLVGNLLGNAMKFTPNGGHVRVECEAGDSDWITMRVRDDGQGIAAAELPRIFDLFMQFDRSSDRAPGGLGIGLTLVKRLVELHGGTVEARSDGPGLGAEFSVRLPRLASGPSRQVEETAAARESAARLVTPRRVLVVDDNVDGALSWAMLLRIEGHEVQVAHDAAAALGIAESFRPEAAIVDIGLPGMDGVELGRRLRAADSDGLLLIAVSGYAADGDRQRTREAGFDHHFRKPIEPDVVLELLAKQSDKAAS